MALKYRLGHIFARTVCSTLVAAPLIIVVENAGAQIPSPGSVPGKEYSNHQDEDAFGFTDFLQNIAWDGFGNAGDAFDYTGSHQPPWNAPIDPDQVDALANHQDYLFHSVATGATPFLASFQSIGDIYSHDTAGTAALWAQGPVDINITAPPDDVDALEIWDSSFNQHNGLGGFDANHFSTIGDAAGPAISIYYYDAFSHLSYPYIFHNQIQAALKVGFTIDVDALMVYDLLGDRQWGPGDSIMFSLHPNQIHDGGEIWVWSFGAAPQFLVHGGRTWDTANNVGAIFGVPTENINALEGIVPSPGTLALLGAAAALFRRRRRCIE